MNITRYDWTSKGMEPLPYGDFVLIKDVTDVLNAIEQHPLSDDESRVQGLSDKPTFDEVLDRILKLKQAGDAIVAELVMHVVACGCQLMVGNTTGEMCSSCEDAQSKIQDYHAARASVTIYMETKNKQV